MTFDSSSIDTPLFRFLQTEYNIIYHICSNYSKKDLFWVRKNIEKLPLGEVLLSLDSIKNQEAVHHENIFSVIQLFKEWKFPINIDFIRFESVYRGMYIVGPKELHMDLSEQCNTNCNFCVTNGPDFMKRIDIDGDKNLENHHKRMYTAPQILTLIAEVQKTGTESLALGITGEPLIHPEIHAILSGLKEIDIRVGFLTNGYLLLKNIEPILANPQIVHFYINISSGNLESFTATRPGDRFQNFLNVWEAIKIIRSERPDIIIRCLYVITPKNIRGIQDFIDLCVRFNISEIELKRVVSYEFSVQEFKFSEGEIDAVMKIIECNKQRGIGINHNFDYILDEFGRILSEPQDPGDIQVDWKELKPMTKNCYNPYFYIALFRNGAYGCGKFISKIGKIPDYDLFRTLFIEKNHRTIIESGLDIEKVL
jgi:wyosine [tRNA(Phe)-imidazoG37] synthetase (radical SAM superfamily)